MRRVGRKWRPSLLLVLGGALAVTLVLPMAGVVAVRLLSSMLGFRHSAILVAACAVLATLILAFLLWRLLLRPITALAERARAIRAGQAGPPAPLAHYGTQELRDLGESVLAMAATLQNREATVRSFTDHVTHELKSPISAIRAGAELLIDGDGLSPGDRRLAGEIGAAAGQMLDLLAALRRVAASREPLHHGQVRLGELLDGLAAEHPGLRLRLAGGALPVPLAAEGMRIVLAQLLSNAAANGAAAVELSVAAEGGDVVLTVADDGAGISEGNRGRIFEPFFTTRRDAGGTGMGLNIVTGLLQAHGAAISLAPSERGAAFVLRFPRGAAQ